MNDLPNTLLVQLFGLRVAGTRKFSLYALYREGDMTFEAVMCFDRGTSKACLDDLLRSFVDRQSFRAAVITPLIREVAAHFGRQT
jgi:hypothetical protein